MVQESLNVYDASLWFSGLRVTLFLLFVCSVLGTLFGGAMALARFYGVPLLAQICAVLGELLRNSPVIVQLFLVYFGIPMFFSIRISQIEAALYVLTANTAAFMFVVFLNALRSVDEYQLNTARTFGLGEVKIFTRILTPQALIVALPMTIGVLVNQAQVTSLVSVIGVIDLTRVGHILNQKTFDSFTVWPIVGGSYLVLALSISFLGNKLEETVRRNSGALREREAGHDD